MKFMTEDFMLHNDFAKKLYHDYAAKMPIFDFHCHLEAKEIYENKNISSITEAWLGGDHYKWRMMRACGVEEKYITGDASDFEKFEKYAEVIPNLIGNPIYHWTHLELKNFFGIDYPLNKENAREVFDRCNELLAKDEFRPRGLIEMSNVAAVCTTNDPAEDLTYHKLLAEDESFKVKVLPAYRPDNALYIEKDGFADYIKKLADASGMEIKTFADIKKALVNRMEYFKELGCMASDQAYAFIPYQRADEKELDAIVEMRLNNEEVCPDSVEKYKTELTIFLAKEYKKLDWAMEIHVGVIRNNSKVLFEKLGPDVGGDSQNDLSYAENLANLLSDFEENDGLPRTVIFPLNPKDQFPIATIGGSFNRANPDNMQNIQLGTAWWHLDHKEGMIEQLKVFSSVGVLAKFIGMLTDSRSFLSYPRHEYFRRILCNFIGELVENGEYPDDEEFLGKVVEDICYNNARKYIKIDL